MTNLNLTECFGTENRISTNTEQEDPVYEEMGGTQKFEIQFETTLVDKTTNKLTLSYVTSLLFST